MEKAIQNNIHETDSDLEKNKYLEIKDAVVDIDVDGFLNKLFQYFDLNDVLQNIKAGTEYIVQVPKEFQLGLDIGQYSMMQNSKTGAMWPSLVEKMADGRQKIVTPLPIKSKDISPVDLIRDFADNYQNIYLQKQLGDIALLLEETLNVVKQVERGQKLDRIGLMTAGKTEMILALQNHDEIALALGRDKVLEARGKFFEVFKDRTESFLPVPKAKTLQFLYSLKPGNYLEEKDREYNEIREYFALYLQSTKLVAISYAYNGDFESVDTLFQLSINEMRLVDFSKLKTLSYAHKGLFSNAIYNNAVDFLNTEYSECLEISPKYDSIMVNVSGKKLLEAVCNEKEI